ncbi:nuclear transport factor 2 family protein [Streptomyces sp. NPDC002574]|uniref:nuclear transport factor 2 family protein n=1 Tax=Streptomyces sp. NPDC002574 TaxID=3364652 RepID=UPI0036951E06
MSTREVIGRIFAHLAEGDAGKAAGVFAEDIDRYVPGSEELPWTGRRTKGADVAPYLRELWSHLVVEDNVDTVEQVLVDGPDAVVLGTFFRRVKATGRTFTTPVAMHLRVDGDRIVRMRLFEDTWLVDRAFRD